VAARLKDEGWLVASRRHDPGPGDLLAVRLDAEQTRHWGRIVHGVWLIEVKGTADGPWRNFSKAARREMLEFALDHGAEAVMAWWPPGGQLRFIHSLDWPSSG
jgi:hypothetical protein